MCRDGKIAGQTVGMGGQQARQWGWEDSRPDSGDGKIAGQTVGMGGQPQLTAIVSGSLYITVTVTQTEKG